MRDGIWMRFFDRFKKSEYEVIKTCVICEHQEKEQIKDIDKMKQLKEEFFDKGCPNCKNMEMIAILVTDKSGNVVFTIFRHPESEKKIHDFKKWFEEGVQYQNKGHWNTARNITVVENAEAEGDYMKAIECFDKALEAGPGNYSAWYNKGVCYQNMGMTDDAMRCYDESIRLNPQFGRAHSNRELLKLVRNSKDK